MTIFKLRKGTAQNEVDTAVGVQGIFRKWLDVKNNQNELIVGFRIGRDTVYTPHRYPYPGEKVKVDI
jgi:hypothetical protein